MWAATPEVSTWRGSIAITAATACIPWSRRRSWKICGVAGEGSDVPNAAWQNPAAGSLDPFPFEAARPVSAAAQEFRAERAVGHRAQGAAEAKTPGRRRSPRCSNAGLAEPSAANFIFLTRASSGGSRPRNWRSPRRSGAFRAVPYGRSCSKVAKQIPGMKPAGAGRSINAAADTGRFPKAYYEAARERRSGDQVRRALHGPRARRPAGQRRALLAWRPGARDRDEAGVVDDSDQRPDAWHRSRSAGGCSGSCGERGISAA